MKVQFKILLSAVMSLALFTQACSMNQVVIALDAVQTGTELTETALSAVCLVAGGLNPVLMMVCTLVPAYLTAVSKGTQVCSTEVASADTNAVKWETCTSGYAAAIVPVLPAGTPPAVVTTLTSLGGTIKALLNLLLPGGASPASVRTALAKGGSLAAFGQAVHKPGMWDRHKLMNIAKRAKKTQAKMEVIKASIK